MKTFLSILVGFALTFKAAAEDIVVATDEWEGYTSKDGQGYYIDLLKAIFPAPEYSLKFEFVPFKRSLLMLKSGKADILLGAYPDDVPAAYLTKYPTNADSISAALNKELAEKWKGLESLTNKTVVAKNAYAFDRYFKTPIKYAEKNNLNSMLQMLKKVESTLFSILKKTSTSSGNLLSSSKTLSSSTTSSLRMSIPLLRSKNLSSKSTMRQLFSISMKAVKCRK